MVRSTPRLGDGRRRGISAAGERFLSSHGLRSGRFAGDLAWEVDANERLPIGTLHAGASTRPSPLSGTLSAGEPARSPGRCA